jgi:inactivated superfamily I helicase
MNGMNTGDIIHEIRDKQMVYMDQKDELVEVKSPTDWIFLANDRSEPWKDIATRNYYDNIHMMNKRSIDRNWQTMLEKLDV